MRDRLGHLARQTYLHILVIILFWVLGDVCIEGVGYLFLFNLFAHVIGLSVFYYNF